ncbi:MAG: DNA-3-methyladenine glycosylase 2 family protein [Bryobacterales bacterium]|nr:DNA-3-methyladenine glycosylase 2 family protein [Bryobacterales bacterium]
MSLDQDLCWEALRTRDARFDGRFFTCVASTGVFCRPVCPARTPLRRNCRFVPSAAAAIEAGFRPCLRCRPETSPGAPAWNGTSALVTRALRLIDAGALDAGNVEALADRLGVGPRHLRRLFDHHLGASPQSVAVTRRLLFAKSLLTETHLAIGQVALASGFASERRFREAFLSAYGRSPSACRKAAGAPQAGVRLALGYRPPYDWDGLLAFLAKRALPGIETIDANAYERRFRLGDAQGSFRVTPKPGKHALEVTLECNDLRILPQVVGRIRRMFDLSADPAGIARGLSADPRMAALVDCNPGLRVPGVWGPFEAAVRAVLGQQVSIEGATKQAAKLARLCNSEKYFPTPREVLDSDLTPLGGPAARRDTLRAVARAFADGAIQPDADFDETRAVLESIPGIGPWTAHYVSMRALGDPDAFPASDLVLRRAWGSTARELSAAAESWRPWRAYAAIHLWRSQS